ICGRALVTVAPSWVSLAANCGGRESSAAARSRNDLRAFSALLVLDRSASAAAQETRARQPTMDGRLMAFIGAPPSKSTGGLVFKIFLAACNVEQRRRAAFHLDVIPVTASRRRRPGWS